MTHCLGVGSPGIDFEHLKTGGTASEGLSSSIEGLSHKATLDNSAGQACHCLGFLFWTQSLKRSRQVMPPPRKAGLGYDVAV